MYYGESENREYKPLLFIYLGRRLVRALLLCIAFTRDKGKLLATQAVGE